MLPTPGYIAFEETGDIRDPPFLAVVACPANPSIVDPLVCDPLNTIDATLSTLPRLTALHLRVRYIDVHDRLYICPEPFESDCDNLDDSTIAPLATFHYTLPHYRQPWSFPSEAATLDLLIRKLHTSLESLMLPVEPAPIQTISSLHWPRLRKLTLRGERWSDPATPIVALFSSMPSLQSLALELSEPKNAPVPSPGVIWPKGHSATPLPWPNLETLRVSYPSPADGVYANLPQSLNTLSLRSWPHECVEIFDKKRPYQPPSWYQGRKDRWWDCPLLTPSNLAQVLRKCDFSLLHTLELEYRVDAHESELLCALTANFPHLTTLEIHRFRRHGEYHVPVTELAEALAPLASLRLLKLHLNFDRMPDPKPGHMMTRNLPRSKSPAFDDTLASAAEELSRMLAPSLEEIWMFKYEYEPLWLVFVVTRACLDGELQTGVVAQKDCCHY
ncbi:hypothetical protein GSI_09489 [Ganoderma sinense ZZ0214-1]|uniref:Uncharacterized protein n=1 Tax=Ganoderma sinense ZZ0214-1 TaxID=1077348 RepID=A0A2G8S449_9APHY|nr:hypothetical protein GSI_09489 [Ganoderma sinense ZZ0214-1]